MSSLIRIVGLLFLTVLLSDEISGSSLHRNKRQNDQNGQNGRNRLLIQTQPEWSFLPSLQMNLSNVIPSIFPNFTFPQISFPTAAPPMPQIPQLPIPQISNATFGPWILPQVPNVTFAPFVFPQIPNATFAPWLPIPQPAIGSPLFPQILPQTNFSNLINPLVNPFNALSNITNSVNPFNPQNNFTNLVNPFMPSATNFTFPQMPSLPDPNSWSSPNMGQWQNNLGNSVQNIVGSSSSYCVNGRCFQGAYKSVKSISKNARCAKRRQLSFDRILFSSWMSNCCLRNVVLRLPDLH